MRKSLLYIWILLLIVGIALIGVRVHLTAAYETATVSVYPTFYKAKDIGEIFKINVTIQDVIDLAGVEFRLGYNTTVLTATLVEYGGIFGASYLEWTNKINETEGWLHYAITRMYGEPTFNGNGTAAIITFRADSYGNSVLDLYDTKLIDSDPPPEDLIAHGDPVDSFISIGAFHDIAVTNVKAYPAEVEASEPVTINLTVTNEGDFNETFNVAVYASTYMKPVTRERVFFYIHPTTGNPIFYYRDPATGQPVSIPREEIAVDYEIIVINQTVSLAFGATTTLTVAWNTTGAKGGNYTVSAKSLLLDDDTRDNEFFAHSTVTIKVHDIAITNVVPAPTEVTVGEHVTIKVTVTNEGDFSDTFNVFVYYDDTAIANQTDITLTNGTSTILTFTWETAGVADGTYTIRAEVPPIPLEADTTDNTYTDGTVIVRGVSAPNILMYVVAGLGVIVVAAVVIYIVKFRKST